MSVEFLILIIIIGFTISECILYFFDMIDQMYHNAKPKHRTEYLELTFFIGYFYIGLNIYIKRCYIKLFKFFERKYAGFIFQGVQVIVFDENDKILVCERNNTVTSIGKYDLGAGGMIGFTKPFENSFTANLKLKSCYAYHTAIEELEEELNIVGKHLVPLKTFTPYDNTTCIIHVFYVIIKNDENISSKDNTYISWKFVKLSDMPEYSDKLKHDGVIIIDYLKNIFNHSNVKNMY